MRIGYVYGLGALCGAVILGMLATPIVGQVRARVDPAPALLQHQ